MKIHEKDLADYAPALRECARRLEARAIVLAGEREEAQRLVAGLEALPFAEREARVRTDPWLATWGVFELLVERSWEAVLADPGRAEGYARTALRVAERLDPERYPPALIEDLRARAWACIGNALRVSSDLQWARRAFTAAARHLEQGTGDPFEQAVLLDLEASLLRDLRRFDQALDHLERAVALFLEERELHRAGRSLVNLSTVYEHALMPEEAIPCLYRALEMIEPEAEPRLLLCASHNLITNLAGAGRYREARSLYRHALPLYRSFPEPWFENRRLWVRGKLARASSRPAAAEAFLRAARDGFLAEGIPYDTALVSLELALLYAEQGRTGELKRLAGELVPVFASRQIHREALAALAFLQRAIETERATREVVSRVAAFLRSAEHDPGLRFEESASG